MEKSSDVRRVREQREPLYVEVKEAILELARTQCGPDRRLPSEEELCRLLGVSRATVREALSILCREGFVSKRHGIGNLVNRSVLDTPMRFDLERGLRRMLEDGITHLPSTPVVLRFRKVTRRQSVKYRDYSAERKSATSSKNVTILVQVVFPLPSVSWQTVCVLN